MTHQEFYNHELYMPLFNILSPVMGKESAGVTLHRLLLVVENNKHITGGAQKYFDRYLKRAKSGLISDIITCSMESKSETQEGMYYWYTISEIIEKQTKDKVLS
jgi:hypothetical protein